jgi:hypothetical protein
MKGSSFMNRQSILDMVDGKIKERVGIEITKAIDNILDENTPAAKPRAVILNIVLTPTADRQHIKVEAETKSKLQSIHPLGAALYIDGDEVYEMTPEISGQTALDGTVQREQGILRLVK